MADALYDDYRERGVIPIHVMLEDCPTSDPDCTFDQDYCSISGTLCRYDSDCPGGETCVPTIDWRDAHQWAYEYDTSNPRDGIVDPFQSGFPVLADSDGSLWSRFSPGCSGCANQLEQLLCLNSCQVTTQTQILDRGFLTVDDTCRHDPPATCSQCVGGGYDDAHVRSVLDSILPVQWCGEATE